MKILQINSVYDYGSTGKIVKSIHEKVLQTGCDSKVIYGRKMVDISDENILKISSRFDNNIHGLFSNLFDSHGLHSKLTTKKILKYITNYNPDIIHLHNIHGYYLNYKMLFKFFKKNSNKLVWTLHDCWSFTGHCAYFDYNKCQMWKSNCACCQFHNTYPKTIFSKSSRNFNLKKELFTNLGITLCTPSEWLKDIVKQSFFKEDNVVVINNGINIDKYRILNSTFKIEKKLNNKKIILGVASIWEVRKGLKHFLDLSPKLSNEYHIVLVGETNLDLSNYHNILHINRTNCIDELVAIYNDSHILFNPTLEDNFPTVNLEALRCGLPVITYNTGGSPEVVNETNGFIVEVGNLEDVIKKISLIDNLSFDRKKISEDAIIYSDDIKFEEYIDLYKKIMEDK